MKAINFANQLLQRLDKSELAPLDERVMLSIAGGSQLCRDIALRLGISSTQCKAALLRLEKLDYLKSVKGKKYSHYHLSSLGEIHIRTLLSFIPFQHE